MIRKTKSYYSTKNIVMKRIILLAITVIVVFVSCGTSKQKAYNDYQYRKWQEEQNNKSGEESAQRPGRTLRTVDPCIELAQADTENLRAYGTATSYVEKTALNEAERDARNRLAAMLKTAVEGAAQDYERNASNNLQNTAGTLGEAIMTQFVAEEVKNTKVIKTSIYDLTDGSVQVYVCIEMKTPAEDFDKKLENTLERDGFIELQYDRERFIKQMKESLEEYKRLNMK